MQRRSGRIEADIAGDDLLRGQCVEPFRVGRLVDIAAVVEQAQEVGFIFGHGITRLRGGAVNTGMGRWVGYWSSNAILIGLAKPCGQ